MQTRMLLICVVIALAGGCTKKEDVIRIGALLSETGSGAPYGKDNRRGVELAVEEVNSAGGIDGKKVLVVYEDDKTTPKGATDGISKLIFQDNVNVVIGSTVSSATLAAAPIADSSNVVLISPGASSPKITNAGDFVFRVWISDELEGSKMADYMFYEDRFKRISLMYINNEYGVGLRNVVERRFIQLGGQIATVESFNQDATDFRAQLAKIKQLNIDGLYLAGYYRELGNLLNQARALALKIPIRSCVTFEDPELLKIAGKNAEDVVYSSPYFDLDDTASVFRSFRNSFKERFGTEPGNFAAHGYDALMVIASALKEGARTGAQIRNLLYKTRDYPGVSGRTTFDQNGDVMKSVAIKAVKDGRFITLRTMP